jgi:WD40 repeat protein
MNINNFDILSPFEPPHLDSVTGLTVSKGRLISGSKDKHLRLWALDHSVNNSKHTLHIFNDYVNALHSTPFPIQVPPPIPSSTLAPRTAK